MCLTLKMKWESHIPKAPGPQIFQTILIMILQDLVAWVIILEIWICLFAFDNTMEIAHPKGPWTQSSPNHINYYTLGLGVLDYDLKNWMCLFTIGNARGISYPKGPWIPGPPNHINYYMFRFGGLDYHLGKLDLFVYHCKCKRHCISQRCRDPGSPKPYQLLYCWVWWFGLSFGRIGSVC